LVIISACQTVAEKKYDSGFTLKLQPDIIAIVSQGSLEPLSLGSYSLRVYQVLDAKFPYDNYVTGLIEPRDGVVEEFMAEDINGDGVKEVIVITRVAGSGAFRSAVAYEYNGKALSIIASVSYLKPDENLMKLLISNYHDTHSD
jgi:hypothetical protein